MALTKVSTDGVKDDAITKAKIPANQIEASELADNSVDTNAIADQAVALSKLPHGDSNNDGKFLRANNGADPTFESLPASGVSVSGNVNNRVATCDGSNLVGASGFTHNSSTQDTQIDGSNNAPVDLIVANTNNSQTAATARISVQAGDNANNGGQLELECNGQYHGFESRSNGNLYISDNGTTKVTLDANGNLSLADGNLIVPSGKGIDFSAQTAGGSPYTSSSSGNNTNPVEGELLDHYESGRWTPSIDYGITAGSTGMSGFGDYTKIGNLVIIGFQWTRHSWADFTLSSGDSAIKISGLPFTPKDTGATGIALVPNLQYQGRTSNGQGGATVLIPPNSAYMLISGLSGSTPRFHIHAMFSVAY